MTTDMIKDILKSAHSYARSTIYDAAYKPGREKIVKNLQTLLDRFEKLQNSDLSNNNRIRLFCRQLKRLMDNNDHLRYHFWHELYYYLIYILNEPESREINNGFQELSEKRLKFEEELERRQTQSQLKLGKQRSLDELIEQHQEHIVEYIDKCKDFHSTLKLTHVIEDIDDFLYKNYGRKDLPLNLEGELKSIEIPLGFLNRYLNDITNVYFTHAQMKKPINSNPDEFLTSHKSELTRENIEGDMIRLLENQRWSIILGDPANGKTTLLRSILRIYADEFSHRYIEKSNRLKEVKYGELNPKTIRIPVLIRIGEFASWLKDHSTKKIIDYIGEHTWYSVKYCSNSSGNMWKDLIDHGHVLILLDGLDEIAEVKNREKIVNLVKEFIDEYVKDPNFISAFDESLFDHFQPRFDVAESQPPKKPGGNQIIITSRVVGYDINPLNGAFIKHCSLSAINKELVNKFAENWMCNVQESVNKKLNKVAIWIDKEISDSLTERRIQAVNSMFKKDKKILFGFSLLSIICTNIFRSLDECCAKSQIEIFNDAVESDFYFSTKNKSTISRDLLEVFLQNFSTYLHLKSSNGLMDTFNIKQLARLTVQKQQNMCNINAKECKTIADDLLKVLQSNTTIVAERGLEVYGFQHLSFQEYFVAQFLVRRYSIDETEYSFKEIADRFLFNLNNPRFRNSLLIALNWIQLKWSKDDFNQFCSALVRSSENYSIPFVAILLFDSLNHMETLSLEDVIFPALNSLLHSPLHLILKTYLIPFLCKVSEYGIQEWMSTYLINDKKSLLKFCQYLLRQFKVGIKSCIELDTESDMESSTESLDSLRQSYVKCRKSNLSVICKQLNSFYNENLSAKFAVGQTLQRIMLLADENDAVSLYQLISTFEPKITVSTIHPLILSVLIVVSGGLIFDFAYKPNNMSWSNRRIYHRSTIMEQLIACRMNQNQITTVIDQYKTDIENAQTSDISDNIVDSFVALICLHKISDIFFNEKYLEYKALSLAFQKIKQSFLFITNSFYEKYHMYDHLVKTSFTNTVQFIIDNFNLSSRQQNSNALTYNFILNKLSIQWSLESVFNHDDDDDDDDNDLETVLKFDNFPKKEWKLPEEDLPKEPSPLLTFVPLSLQKLYSHLFINRTDESDALPLVVLLAQRSIYLEDINVTDPNFDSSLNEFKSQCKEHFLENYLYVLLRNDLQKEFHQTTNDFTLSNDLKKRIVIECRRVSEANHLPPSQHRDCRLFAASISLARLSQYQADYLSSFPNQDVLNAIKNISNPILQIITYDFILEIENSFIFEEKQRKDLDFQIILLLKDIKKIPLLTLTYMIIRFYKQRKDFRLVSLIGETFGETENYEHKQAASIALKQYGHLHYLSKLFDPTQWNSSLLFRCFNKQRSFQSFDNTFLSLIYLTELAFDAHVLQIYANNHDYISQNNIDSSNKTKIMTYEAAKWVNNYLQDISNNNVLNKVIAVVFKCLIVEDKARDIIQEWCAYRYENKLKIFAQYAALQLFITGSKAPHLIEIINEILSTKDEIHLNSFIEHIFNSEINDIDILSEILRRWNKNQYYSSKISIWIRCKTVFNQILRLEHERINQPSQTAFNSFLFLIKGCSYDLQVELIEHLRRFIEQTNGNNNSVNKQYVSNIIKWIIQCQIWNNNTEEYSQNLYDYIFSFFDHQSYHDVHKTILITLHSVLREFSWQNKKHILMTNNTLHHIEKIIFSYSSYPDDVLAICLLTYGIYLYKLIEINNMCDVSEEIQKRITELFKSKSTIISSRAGLCLIIIKQQKEWSEEIPNWFKEEYSLTAEDEYNMLLQQTLFGRSERSFFDDLLEGNKIVRYISNQSDDIFNKFVCELGKHLENKCSNNYSSDPSPDYVYIASHFDQRNSKKFQNALQKNSINEEQLKTNLYSYAKYAKLSTDYEAAVNLYASFGTLTEELKEMLEWGEDRYTDYILIDLRNIKDVSDRKIIEHLFDKLKFLLNNGKFRMGLVILRLLIRLGEADLVSLIEIHQEVSKIMKDLSPKTKVPEWFYKQSVFNDLLDLSNAKKDISLDGWADRNDPNELFSINDMDFEFETKIQQLKHLSMYTLKKKKKILTRWQIKNLFRCCLK